MIHHIKHHFIFWSIIIVVFGGIWIWGDPHFFFEQKVYLLENTGYTKAKAICVISRGSQYHYCVTASKEDNKSQ